MKIHLKCGLENCNDGYEYTFNSLYPTAINGQFSDEESKGGDWGGLLPKKPETGKTYELKIWGALKIDLDDHFWVLYLDPYSMSEGIENEAGFESFAFCLCKQVDIIEIQERSIRLNVRIIEVKDLKGLLAYPHAKYGHSPGLDDEATSKTNYHIENFKEYSIITINIQGDLGWKYIVAKKDNKSIIIAENSWDFHENIWHLMKEELTEAQEKKYGIEHRLP
jgi:hypothetical protein